VAADGRVVATWPATAAAEAEPARLKANSATPPFMAAGGHQTAAMVKRWRVKRRFMLCVCPYRSKREHTTRFADSEPPQT
jgi:hypothetical protein